MQDDRVARDMAAIKARESEVRQAIARGDTVVDAGPFGMSQLGLLPVIADEWGRLWIVHGSKLERVLTAAPGAPTEADLLLRQGL